MSTSKISKELSRDHRTLKKALENITKLRTRSKGKAFKNLLPQNESKLKRVIEPLLTSGQILEKGEIEGFKKDKRCRKLCELGSVKYILGNLLSLKQIS